MKKSAIIASVLALSLLMPTMAVLAQAGAGNTAPPAGAGNSGTPPTGAGTSGGVTASGGISNPLKGVDSLAGFFYLLANFIYSLSYAVIAFFLILSGFKFVKAQGNPEELANAKKTFYYTIIGAVLLIGAQVIAEIVRDVINQFAKNPI